mmetsp:Transcript_20202/g.26052  ORF Transcript_20202/g.26052 Transcript_20202/m.26052 type:complete len:324 (-) Transcript_20202:288-1259(-)
MLKLWFEKLVTKEDVFFVHKILAILCLASFAWRSSHMGVEADMGFATYPKLTTATIILHLALNLSSFQFQIPPRRIATGYRIWPEYRLHSLVFLCRALAIMTLYWIEDVYDLDPMPTMNVVIILLAMVSGDLASRSVGKFHSKSIRELDVPAWVKFFFSTMQFFGTTGLLLGFPQRRFSTPFWHVIIIQGNAFLMTVRRKNLSSEKGLLTIYGVGLLSALTVTIIDLIPQTHFDLQPFLVAVTIACSVAFLRFGGLSILMPSVPGLRMLQSKYVLWVVFGVWWTRIMRPLLLDQSSEAEWIWVTALVSLAALICLGLYRSVHE